MLTAFIGEANMNPVLSECIVVYNAQLRLPNGSFQNSVGLIQTPNIELSLDARPKRTLNSYTQPNDGLWHWLIPHQRSCKAAVAQKSPKAYIVRSWDPKTLIRGPELAPTRQGHGGAMWKQPPRCTTPPWNGALGSPFLRSWTITACRGSTFGTRGLSTNPKGPST